MTKERIALVTGAAKGIGKAIVDRFISENYFVIAVDIDELSGKSLIDEYGSSKVLFQKVDICNEQEIHHLFVKIKNDYKHLNVLINNAGIIRDNMIWNMPVEDFDLVINVNLKGTWLLCKEAAKLMKQQNSGRIVNIASRAWLGNRGQTNYAASKAGVVSMTRVLALELGKYNVYVNAIAPGFFPSEMTQAFEKDPTMLKYVESRTSINRWGKDGELNGALLYFASDASSYTTGQILAVDGGWLAE